jgi:hypothetical protein
MSVANALIAAAKDKNNLTPTEKRRAILAVLVGRKPGATRPELTEVAKKLWKEGRWPPLSHEGEEAKEPYTQAIYMSLKWLVDHEVLVVRIKDTDSRLNHYYTAGDAAQLDSERLPQGEEREEALAMLRRVAAETRCDMALGITSDYGHRVIRMRTARGLVDFPLRTGYGRFPEERWVDAIQRLMDEMFTEGEQ